MSHAWDDLDLFKWLLHLPNELLRVQEDEKTFVLCRLIYLLW